MTGGDFGLLQGRSAPVRTRYVGPRRGGEPIEVTVLVRRRGGAPAAAAWPAPLAVNHQRFRDLCGADPADITRLREFAHTHGLQEIGCQPHRRVLQWRRTGPGCSVFGVQLGRYRRLSIKCCCA